MLPAPSARAIALIALLANAPVLAQDAGQQAPSPELQVAAVCESAATAALTSEAIEAKPAWHSTAVVDHGHRIWRFVHAKTVQPAINLAWYSGEWIASSSNAAIIAAQNAGVSLHENAKVVASAAYDMGEQVASSTSAALDSAVDTASSTINSLAAVGEWSVHIVKEVESHLRGDGTSEFAMLIRESGFALANIKVGVGIIPELTVEFRHERNLDPAELTAYKVHVQNYAQKSSGPVGYFEALLLNKLAKAGEYSGGMRISELHIDVFPLPSMEVYFDPFRYEEEQNKMLVEALTLAEMEQKAAHTITDRIARLEAAVAALRGRK
jgi:hypothetical protein